MHVRGSLRDLETRGFVVVESFLSVEELELLRHDFQKCAKRSTRRLDYCEAGVSTLERLSPKIEAIVSVVRGVTNIHIDDVLPPLARREALYFDTKYVNSGWHVDHHSYYLLQNHYDYLNFWIPIIKPLPDKSGLGVIPMDQLQDTDPRLFQTVLGRGAFALGSQKDGLQFDDGYGRNSIPVNVDIKAIAQFPAISVGDALILRGDVFHRTGDTETYRVAWSYRVASTRTVLKKSTMLVGPIHKCLRMVRWAHLFQRNLAGFWYLGKNEITIGDLNDMLVRIERTELRPVLVLLTARVLYWTIIVPHLVRAILACIPFFRTHRWLWHTVCKGARNVEKDRT